MKLEKELERKKRIIFQKNLKNYILKWLNILQMIDHQLKKYLIING